MSEDRERGVVISDVLGLDIGFERGGGEMGFVGTSSDCTFGNTQIHASPRVEFKQFVKLWLKRMNIVRDYGKVIRICRRAFLCSGCFEGVTKVISLEPPDEGFEEEDEEVWA